MPLFIALLLDPRLKKIGLSKLHYTQQDEYNAIGALEEIFQRYVYILLLLDNILIYINRVSREEFNDELPLTQQQQEREEDNSLDDFEKSLYSQNIEEDFETETSIYFQEPISHYKVSY